MYGLGCKDRLENLSLPINQQKPSGGVLVYEEQSRRFPPQLHKTKWQTKRTCKVKKALLDGKVMLQF